MLLGEDDTLMSEGTLFSRLFNERSPFCAYDEKAESSSLSTMSDCKQQYASTGSYREQKTDIHTTWPNTSEHVGPTIQNQVKLQLLVHRVTNALRVSVSTRWCPIHIHLTSFGPICPSFPCPCS